MRIGVDVDNVLYPLAQELQEYFSRRLGVQLPVETHWNSHELHWGLSKNQYHEIISEGIEDGDLFRHADPLPGAADALWALQDLGHTIVVATARHKKTAGKLTREWLIKHRLIHDELIFDGNKCAANADIFIDDKPTTVPKLMLAGTQGVFMHQAWNAHLTAYPRVHSWAEFVTYVQERAG